MSLATALRRLSRVNDMAPKEARRLATEHKQQQAVSRMVLEAATAEVTPLIREYLSLNLRHSGLNKITGRLTDAVANANVTLVTTRNLPYLRIQFKQGMPDNKTAKKSSEKSVYVYGSSHNFGATYLPGGQKLGQKVKARIKRAVIKKADRLRYQKSKDQVSARTTRRRKKRKPMVVKGQKIISSSGIVVIRPRNFFKLLPQQRQIVVRAFTDAVNRLQGQIASRN